MDCYGDHLQTCKSTDFTGRHRAVQEALFTIAQAAGQHVAMEVVLSRAPKMLRPADILLSGFHHGQDLAVDLTITHPIRSSVPKSAEGAATVLSRACSTKQALYGKFV